MTCIDCLSEGLKMTVTERNCIDQIEEALEDAETILGKEIEWDREKLERDLLIIIRRFKHE